MRCLSIISFNECYTPNNWHFQNVSHPFSMMYYALGGSAFYTIDGVEQRFKKNHLYILPANKIFSLRELSYDKFYLLYIHAYTFPEINDLIEIDVSTDEFISDTLKMLRDYMKKSTTGEPYLHRLTEMLFSYIFRNGKHTDISLPERIKKHIESNFVSVFKANDLSTHFNYSNSHISKIFKSEYNQTPKQYAEQLILREIVVLLHEGLLVSEISRRLSFSSPENLCRFFKSAYGYSPTEYIRKFKNPPI